MAEKKKKGMAHGIQDGKRKPTTKATAPRATRAITRKNKQHGKSSGRKPGKIDPEWGLTPNQKRIARKMLEAELEDGLFPASVAAVAKVSGAQPAYVRDLLKRKEFQAYLMHLLELEGVVLEGAFWRGLALGLQTGDVKVLELYARMTGKIDNQKDTKVVIEVTSPDGQPALPVYEVEEADIVEVGGYE